MDIDSLPPVTPSSPTGLALIVDDDVFTRTLLTDIVQEEGHRVITAPDGKSALFMLEKHAVDVAVVDLILPDMHGLELLERIRRTDASLEVIICSASKDADSVVAALRGRAFDYLVKPVVPAVLQRAVGRALHSRRLLGENNRLRRALNLVQAGQGLLSTTDMPSLLQRAAETLETVCGAPLVAVGTPGDPGVVARGWPEAEAKGALAFAGAQGLAAPDVLSTNALRIPPVGPCLVASLGPPGVMAVAARQPGADPFSPQDLEGAQFLVRHAHLALHNHVRFAAVADAARRDHLTGLLNAQVLQAAVHQAVSRTKQGAPPFALCFLDLDGFKQVNDVHGHLQGSRLLVELAGVLTRTVRDGDVVSRYGGDEFVIILTDAAPQDALRVAERLRARVADHIYLVREGLQARVSASVGLAIFPGDAEDAATLMARADAAMYQAKRTGKNRVVQAATMPADPKPAP